MVFMPYIMWEWYIAQWKIYNSMNLAAVKTQDTSKGLFMGHYWVHYIGLLLLLWHNLTIIITCTRDHVFQGSHLKDRLYWIV